MKRLVLLTILCAALAGCDSRDGKLPFYLTHVEEMKKLPQEDLLRMKDNILARSAELPDQTVGDPAPAGGKGIAMGELRAANEHKGVAGTAVLYEGADGSATILLKDFHVPNAPDLNLVVGEITRPLRGNAGTQAEALPPGKYPRVAIRSLLFDETFAEAELAGQ